MSEKKHTKAEALNEGAEGLSRTRSYTYEPKKYRYHGRRVTLKELAAECDVSARTLRRRIGKRAVLGGGGNGSGRKHGSL